MDKRANLRQHFQTEAITASTDKQYQQRTAQLKEFENTLIVAMNTLIKFLDGKTTKTEVVNQLSSISTPDMDKVVQAVSKLDKDILANKLDLKPVTDGLNSLKRELSLIPKTLPKIPEAKDAVKVTNLSEIKLDTTAVEKAIKALKLDVKAPIINTEKTDITPLKDVMLDLLKAINNQKPVEIPKFPEIPKTDLTKVEKKLDESNKHLKKLVEKPVGGGGGGGNGSPYIDSTGKIVNVELTAGGEIPVSATLASSPEYIKLAGSDANERDSTYYGDGLTSGVMAVHERYFDGAAYNRTPASKVLVDKSVTNIIYIGKAPIGTATSAAAWQLKKIDKTTNPYSITYANGGAFTAIYDDILTETYT